MEEIANSPRYRREPYTLLPLLKVSHVFINKTSITLRYSINRWHEHALKPAAKLQKETIGNTVFLDFFIDSFVTCSVVLQIQSPHYTAANSSSKHFRSVCHMPRKGWQRDKKNVFNYAKRGGGFRFFIIFADLTLKFALL